jgi:leucyl aminopeptidase
MAETGSVTAQDSSKSSGPERHGFKVRLQLVSIDVLQALAGRVDDPEDASSVNSVSSVVPALPPPQTVVTSATTGPDGVVATDSAIRLAAEYRIDLLRRIRRAKATGKPGEIVGVELEDDITEHLLVLGVGDGSPSATREAGAKLASRIDDVETVLCDVTASMSKPALRAFCEGLLLASYRFSRKTTDTPTKTVTVQLAVASVSSSQPVVDRAVATARAVVWARDLANRPSNEKNPQWIAERAVELGVGTGMRVRVLEESALVAGGFGGLLAVGGGSASPPRLIVLEHRRVPTAPHVVLIGKGITFDSGGLCIKPADGMPLMKTDMSGAAAVLAVMSALSELNITANVTGVLACAENMPSGGSYRPGDVVTHYDGQTSEVLDTDAEGRMVLADAIAYAAAQIRCDVIVDIATLTGAATLGLSRIYGALFTADQGLAKRLVQAGNESNDRVWEMPLVEEYRFGLDSPIADIAHLSRGKTGGGSITAGLFLREFTHGKRWAHIDMAGPGRAEAPRAELTRGATGFGVRILLRWLEDSPHLW